MTQMFKLADKDMIQNDYDKYFFKKIEKRNGQNKWKDTV